MKEETKDTKIQELMKEVEVYRQAIRDARDALAAADGELDEELTSRYEEEQE